MRLFKCLYTMQSTRRGCVTLYLWYNLRSQIIAIFPASTIGQLDYVNVYYNDLVEHQNRAI